MRDRGTESGEATKQHSLGVKEEPDLAPFWFSQTFLGLIHCSGWCAMLAKSEELPQHFRQKLYSLMQVET